MTTDERIENVERELARAKRCNRWLLAGLGLALGVSVVAGVLGPTTAGAQGAKAAAVEPQGLPRYQIAVCDNLGGPYVLDTYTGDLYMAAESADAQRWKKEPSKVVKRA